MKPFKQLSPITAGLVLGLTVLLVFLAGWHREMASRYPVADLPFVDGKRLERQLAEGNVGKTEALYYRKDYAGADTTEIR